MIRRISNRGMTTWYCDRLNPKGIDVYVNGRRCFSVSLSLICSCIVIGFLGCNHRLRCNVVTKSSRPFAGLCMICLCCLQLLDLETLTVDGDAVGLHV